MSGEDSGQMQQVTFKWPQFQYDDLQFKCTLATTHLHDSEAQVKETKKQILSLWEQLDKAKAPGAVMDCGQELEKLYKELEKRNKHLKTQQDAKYDVELKIAAIWRKYSKDKQRIHDRRETIGKPLVKEADRTTNLTQFSLNMLRTTPHLVPMVMAHPACNPGSSTEWSARCDSMRLELFGAGVPDTSESTDLEVETAAVDTDLEVETAAVDTDLEGETAAVDNANQRLPANVAGIIIKYLDGWALIDLDGGRKTHWWQDNAAGK